MKAILAIMLALAARTAHAGPRITSASVAEAAAATARIHDRTVTRAYFALEAADAEVVQTRARWDAAVAGDHPVPAGEWAQKHFTAMQVRRAAYEAWVAAAQHAAEP